MTAVHGRTFSSISRMRLLDAARGVLDDTRPLGILKCFPLKRQNVNPTPQTPSEFHSTLCRLIRQAKTRVTLASLYVGPAADTIYEKEVELLDSIREASSQGVDVKILLDQHRALRPVPVKGSKTSTITSAEACKQVLTKTGKIHLLSVLPLLLDRLLPNPYNEVAGVFHIKAYIIDDHLILSGANLSEEYFVDRIDRYLWISCPNLVQCYQDLVDALCDHGVEYGDNKALLPPKTTRKALLDSLRRTLTTSDPGVYNLDEPRGSEDPIAYAVPTFHAPPSYVRRMNIFRSDQKVLESLLKEAVNQQQQYNHPLACRISTAYLNPTDTFLRALEPLQQSIFLTAGRVSHGFKPKPKAGNKGRDWIPTVFEHSAQLASQKMSNALVAYYQRPDWSFHAKGIWLTNHGRVDQYSEAPAAGDIRLLPDAEVYAVTHGSSNYGQRSAYRDMESNLFLVLPETSPLVTDHIEEWNRLCDFAVSAEVEGTRPILPQIRGSFPLIRYFF